MSNVRGQIFIWTRWGGGAVAVQGLCFLGSKVSAVRTLHKVWANKSYIYGLISRSGELQVKDTNRTSLNVL